MIQKVRAFTYWYILQAVIYTIVKGFSQIHCVDHTNSIANALELRLSCTNTFMITCLCQFFHAIISIMLLHFKAHLLQELYAIPHNCIQFLIKTGLEYFFIYGIYLSISKWEVFIYLTRDAPFQ